MLYASCVSVKSPHNLLYFPFGEFCLLYFHNYHDVSWMIFSQHIIAKSLYHDNIVIEDKISMYFCIMGYPVTPSEYFEGWLFTF